MQPSSDNKKTKPREELEDKHGTVRAGKEKVS
jgi:hypothetical protein